MDRSVILIRFCYWLGAVLDGVVGFQLWSQLLASRQFDLDDQRLAALMLGWTLLLVWADRRPIERRGVLLLTVFLFASGLFYSAFALLTQQATWSEVLPLSAAILVMAVVFCIAYRLGSRLAQLRNGTE
jgi:peptidoglycan/LPS O-acetylase OafA/YrhL